LGEGEACPKVGHEEGVPEGICDYLGPKKGRGDTNHFSDNRVRKGYPPRKGRKYPDLNTSATCSPNGTKRGVQNPTGRRGEEGC